MRRLMAANWKMYKTSEEAAATIEHLSKLLGGSAPAGSEILVFAPFTALEAAAAAMRQMIRQVEIFPLSASISMDSTHLWITVERAFCRVWRKQV